MRSTELDEWTQDQLNIAAAVGGNDKANEYWEALKPPDFQVQDDTVAAFIVSKYAKEQFVKVEG